MNRRKPPTISTMTFMMSPALFSLKAPIRAPSVAPGSINQFIQPRRGIMPRKTTGEQSNPIMIETTLAIFTSLIPTSHDAGVPATCANLLSLQVGNDHGASASPRNTHNNAGSSKFCVSRKKGNKPMSCRPASIRRASNLVIPVIRQLGQFEGIIPAKSRSK